MNKPEEATGNSKKLIISAARELFWKNGYEATSPRDIQNRSGVGQGSFYHHFRSKEELGKSVIKEISQEMSARLDVIFAANKAPGERISDYLRIPRDPLKGCQIGRFLYEEGIRDSAMREPIAEYFNNLEAKLIEALSELNIAKKLGKSETELESVAKTIITVVQGGYLLSRAKNDLNEMEMAITGLSSLLDNFIN